MLLPVVSYDRVRTTFDVVGEVPSVRLLPTMEYLELLIE